MGAVYRVMAQHYGYVDGSGAQRVRQRPEPRAADDRALPARLKRFRVTSASPNPGPPHNTNGHQLNLSSVKS